MKSRYCRGVCASDMLPGTGDFRDTAHSSVSVPKIEISSLFELIRDSASLLRPFITGSVVVTLVQAEMPHPCFGLGPVYLLSDGSGHVCQHPPNLAPTFFAFLKSDGKQNNSCRKWLLRSLTVAGHPAKTVLSTASKATSTKRRQTQWIAAGTGVNLTAQPGPSDMKDSGGRQKQWRVP